MGTKAGVNWNHHRTNLGDPVHQEDPVVRVIQPNCHVVTLLDADHHQRFSRFIDLHRNFRMGVTLVLKYAALPRRKSAGNLIR